ncbi:MAG: metal-dependent hydrolase [Deltaproteobacteria bacterium]|nr:metal-dependent hydrolase [Deltaproteobacteria bacterium]MBI3294673.1 metal-dependent hydrolase [Deltaproteobacteria bacterium]
MPSTFVHGLLPSSCVALRRSAFTGLTRWQGFAFWLSCAVIGNLPDLDVIGVLFFPGLAKLIHRNFGHNIFALVLWTVVGKQLILRATARKFSVRKAYIYSALLVVSHVILDCACQDAPGVPAGVPLFWPLSAWKLASPVPLFVEYSLQVNRAWFLGHLLASDYWTRAIFNEVKVSVIGLALFLLGDRLVLALSSWHRVPAKPDRGDSPTIRGETAPPARSASQSLH